MVINSLYFLHHQHETFKMFVICNIYKSTHYVQQLQINSLCPSPINMRKQEPITLCIMYTLSHFQKGCDVTAQVHTMDQRALLQGDERN